MKRKEIFWFIGTIALVLIINFAFFGIDGFKADATFDVNIHDTYFLMSHLYFVLLIGVFIFFGVYLVRTIAGYFKNLSANLILMLSMLFLILILTGATSVLNFTLSVNSPQNKNDIISESEHALNDFKFLSDIFYAIQIIMIIFLAYIGFKTGQNHKREI